MKLRSRSSRATGPKMRVPARVVLRVDQDRGVLVEGDVGAVGAAELLAGADDDRLDDLALADAALRGRLLDRRGDHVADAARSGGGEPPLTRMQRISRAPELSATLSLVSCWIIAARPSPGPRPGASAWSATAAATRPPGRRRPRPPRCARRGRAACSSGARSSRRRDGAGRCRCATVIVLSALLETTMPWRTFAAGLATRRSAGCRCRCLAAPLARALPRAGYAASGCARRPSAACARRAAARSSRTSCSGARLGRRRGPLAAGAAPSELEGLLARLAATPPRRRQQRPPRPRPPRPRAPRPEPPRPAPRPPELLLGLRLLGRRLLGCEPPPAACSSVSSALAVSSSAIIPSAPVSRSIPRCVRDGQQPRDVARASPEPRGVLQLAGGVAEAQVERLLARLP